MTRRRRLVSCLAAGAILAASGAAGGFAGYRSWQRGQPHVVRDSGDEDSPLSVVSPRGDLIAVWGETADAAKTAAVASDVRPPTTVRLASTLDGATARLVAAPAGESIVSATFSSSGEWLAVQTAAGDKTTRIRLFSSKNGEPGPTALLGPCLRAWNFRTSRLRFTPSDARLLVSTRAGWIPLTMPELTAGQPIDPDEPLGVGAIAFRDDGRVLHAGLSDVSRVWLEKRTSSRLFGFDTVPDSALAERGDVVVTARTIPGGEEVDVTRIPSGEVSRRFAVPQGAGVACLAASPEGDLVAAGLSWGKGPPHPDGGSVVVWSVETGAVCLEAPSAGLVAVAFSPARDLVVGTGGGKLHLWPFRRR